jgi:predicted  nucleic acid-binding Zn-ribbon protein
LENILQESHEEEKKLMGEREKAVKKIEDKNILKHYDRLRSSLSNGLAVVRVVRGAAEGCNIVIPPQKIAEIREKKKIVIDEHSGRILADVDMESLDDSDKPKKAGTTPAPTRRRKTVG